MFPKTETSSVVFIHNPKSGDNLLASARLNAKNKAKIE